MGRQEKIKAALGGVFAGPHRCIMCGREEVLEPARESHWRCVVLDGTPYFACPGEFPPDTYDGSGKAAFKAAYEKVLRRATELWRDGQGRRG